MSTARELQRPIPKGLIIGLFLSACTTAAITALLTTLTMSQIIPESKTRYVIMITLLVSAMTISASSNMYAHRKRGILCLLSAVLYFLLLSIVHIVIGNDEYSAVAPTLLLVSGGSLLPIFWGNSQKKRDGKRKQRRHKW